MPSVMGPPGERERAARRRVEVLQAELREAEAAWERFVIARQTVAEVLAAPRAGEEEPPAGLAGERHHLTGLALRGVTTCYRATT
ncbi:hypothetical protein P3T35_000784 [Kitasatospora sp. GP30]|nr:hypothetical protein [Kitasatospora sp. GP30]